MLKAWTRIYEWTKTWAAQYYPGWKSGVFFCLILSYLFLALSGFLFALFVSRGLFGFPLLLHVAIGGLFSICFSLTVVWRARDYSLDTSRTLFFKVIFWTFVASGLCLLVTALGSMLSFLSMEIQMSMIRVHRFFAFISLLCVTAFVYFSLNREE